MTEQQTELIELIEPSQVLTRLGRDIAADTNIALWCYTVEPRFFELTFLADQTSKRISVLLDWKQRYRLAWLQHEHHEVHVRHWQRNRTQHDKSILFRDKGVAWVTTSNLHRGSFLLANNRALRLTHPEIVHRMENIFDQQWRISEPCEE
jgi:hypothetical protein